MSLSIGQILQGRYLVQSLLGQGGMGSVYCAQDQRLGRPVAIKERTPDPAASADGLEQARLQFQREAQILALLSHPNLPQIHDYFSFGGNEYVVMELIEGEGLDKVVERQGAISEAIVIEWATQLLDALAYIHARNIIHRDIKPANIILRHAVGSVVLVDFGLVKLVDPSNPNTMTAMRAMGTAGYAPLEQFTPGMHTDARSDIYSFGATLYHLLAGIPPADVHERLLDPTAQPALRAVKPGISPVTESVVAKAVQIWPQARFQNAAEMRQALATPISAPGVTPRPSAPQPSMRTEPLIAAAPPSPQPPVMHVSAQPMPKSYGAQPAHVSTPQPALRPYSPPAPVSRPSAREEGAGQLKWLWILIVVIVVLLVLLRLGGG